jgi:hypothetical protein
MDDKGHRGGCIGFRLPEIEDVSLALAIDDFRHGGLGNCGTIARRFFLGVDLSAKEGEGD